MDWCTAVEDGCTKQEAYDACMTPPPGYTKPIRCPQINNHYERKAVSSGAWIGGYYKTWMLECPVGSAWDDVEKKCTGPTSGSSGPLRITQFPSCAANANPCYPATGDKARFERGFSFAGRSFDYSYPSNRQVSSSLLSLGWVHSIEERLIKTNSSNFIFYIDNKGYYQIFKFATGGAEAISESGELVMRRVANDVAWAQGIRIISKNGDVRHFDSIGRLVSIRNASAPDRDVLVEYDPSNAWKPTILRDAKGRSIAFEYDGQARLSKILVSESLHIAFDYDVSGNLAAVGPAGSQRQFHYESGGSLLTGLTGEDGVRHATFSYDGDGRVLTSALHAGGGYTEVTTLDYVGSGTVDVHTPNGAVKTYTISSGAVPRITGLTSSAGATSFSFNTEGRLTGVVVPGGSTTSYVYQAGKLIQRIEAADTEAHRRSDYAYDSSLRVVRTHVYGKAGGVDVLKALDSLRYDGDGRLAGTCSHDVNASGSNGYSCASAPVPPVGVRQTRYTYCTSLQDCPILGLLKSADGPRLDISDAENFTYYMSDDAGCGTPLAACRYRKGDLWKVTNALGHVSEVLEYDDTGRVLSVKDQNNVITDMEYHPQGWLTARKVRGVDPVSEADDRITRIDYWPTGLVSSVTLPDGSVTSYVYDAAHRLTDIVDMDGNRLHYTLDNAGNRMKEEVLGENGAIKRTLSRVYNTLGQLATQADAQANPTDFTYDASGNSKTVSDALGHVTSNDYDPLDRLKRTLQDVGGIEAETKFAYDANDNLTTVTDPKGLDTTYSYNGFGDQVQLSSPDTGVTSFTYDSAGNRASQTDARGITTTYQYDALNRLTQVGYPTTSLNVSYTYDITQPVCQAGETFSVGRLTLMVDGSGSTQYCHDRFGQMVRKVQTANGVALTLQYAYTKSGQLQAMTYPDGTVADYVRNAQGQIISVGVTRPGLAREILLHQATYHPFGPIAGWVYGNGRTTQRDVDLDYRPTSIQGGTGGLDLTYGYDAVGNLVDINSGSSPPMEYRYDALGRLTEALDGPAQAVLDKYEYDKTGNRISYTDSFGTKAYAYPANSHRLDSVAGENRAYDAVGNTLSIGTVRAFDYDDAGRMSRVRNGGVVAMEYAYNGRGEQVRKHLGASETQALYDEAGRWLGDYGTSGVVSQQAIWIDDMPVGVLDTGQLYYIQPDHLGTPRTVIDPVRDVVVWAWDAKGEVFGNTPPEQDADGDSAVFVFDMRFPGQRADSATQLSYNYFREYDAGTGRYVQSDPIGLAGGVSTYQYVYGSPLRMTDALGLQTVDTFTTYCSKNPMACAGIMGGTTAGAVAIPKVATTNKDACDEDPCEEIVRDIRAAMQEINRRHEDMLVDKCNMYRLAHNSPNPSLGSGCPGSWRGHKAQIVAWQNRLKSLISKANRNNCIVPFGAYEAAWRPQSNMPRGY